MSPYESERHVAAGLYLRMLSAYAPPRALLDVRYRTPNHEFARFFLEIHAPDAASTLTRVGQRTDLYVGVAARLRRRGARQDIAPTPLLWADCDTPAAVAALLAFDPAPSMIVSSGSGEPPHANAHAYWALTRCLTAQQLQDANRRLASALGADPRCADAARILRVPDTLNFKHRPPRRVRLEKYSELRFRPVEILTRLPPLSTPQAARVPAFARGRSDVEDPLRSIAPADYVPVLTGRQPGRDGKINCPFHTDQTPSFHVYHEPQEGWTCFGCTTASGKPLGGDIYTLASLLWRTPARGRSFLELRSRLDSLFGVTRE